MTDMIQKLIYSLVTLVWALSPLQTQPNPNLRVGKVFEKDSHQSQLLFNFRSETKSTGDVEKTDSAFTDPSGAVAATEAVTLKGGEFLRFEVRLNQVNESGTAEKIGDKIYFTYTKEGVTRKSDEKASGVFLVGPTIVPYLEKNWAEIQAGRSLSVRLGVPSRQETVGFEYFKTGSGDGATADRVEVKMKPKSFIIAALVDPILFNFNWSGSKLIRVIGRTTPLVKVDGKWKPLDAETVYE